MRFTNIHLLDNGFAGQDEETRFSTNFPVFLIHEAWGQGADYEPLADGFGPGEGTHGDWSAIRDSTPDAIAAMFQVALNILFGANCDCGFAYLNARARHTPECSVTAGQVVRQVAAVHAELSESRDVTNEFGA